MLFRFNTIVLALASLTTVAEASVPLIQGDPPVFLPGATLAVEADLAGTVILDDLLPFRITNAAGALLFEGKLQNRIVRSSSTGLLHFYYRIRDTTPGLNGVIKSVWTNSFDASPRVLADWRPDGLGLVNPVRGQRSPGLGQLIRFDFNTTASVLIGGRDSRFFFLKTTAKEFSNLGHTRIQLTSGDSTVIGTSSPKR